MVTRILPQDEWSKLAGTDLATALPMLPGTRVIVCELEGAIVGHLALVPMWHAEGFYVAPAHRGRGAHGLLIDAMHAEARALGVGTVFPAAARHDEGMVHLITRIGGVEIEARWFALTVKES